MVITYTISQYFSYLKLAKRSPETIRLYRVTLEGFARVLKVSPDDLHNHLTPDNLIQYAISQEGTSPKGSTNRLRIIYRYYRLNKVEVPELERSVINGGIGDDEPNDKPLTLAVLKKMMDAASHQGKALILVLISTGMRAGELSKIRLSDVNGDTITIPGAITKTKRGRKVYLTEEARDALDRWLKVRPKYLAASCHRHFSAPDKANDDRLFCGGYMSLRTIWTNLFEQVDGERGKYWRKLTPHSCRKYFRTHAAKTMDIDLVEQILGHSGYLTRSYVRITDEDARRMFHEGEHALYITRPDQRVQDGELAHLRERVGKMDALEAKVAALEELAGYGKPNEP